MSHDVLLVVRVRVLLVGYGGSIADSDPTTVPSIDLRTVTKVSQLQALPAGDISKPTKGTGFNPSLRRPRGTVISAAPSALRTI